MGARRPPLAVTPDDVIQLISLAHLAARDGHQQDWSDMLGIAGRIAESLGDVGLIDAVRHARNNQPQKRPESTA